MSEPWPPPSWPPPPGVQPPPPGAQPPRAHGGRPPQWPAPSWPPPGVPHERAAPRRSGPRPPRPGWSPRSGSLLVRAPITLLLIAANVVVFLISREGAPAFIDKWGEVPGEIQYLGRTYQLFTAPWIHVSVEHIGLNMLSLLIVGPMVEAAVGKARYLLLYLGSAMGGSVLYFLVAPPRTPGVGASGAIFGVFGALFVVSRKRGVETGGVVALIVVNLVYGFVEPNVGWQAHLGGLAAGVGMAAGFILAERWRGVPARLVEGATCAVASVLMLGLLQLPCRHIPGI